MANLMPGRDRAVSVARLDGPPTPATVRDRLLGREAYRRTRFIVCHHGSSVTVVAVERADPDALFSPIVSVDVLAAPDECAWVDAPEADTTVPTQMAAAAREHAPGARCVVVRGRYEHVNFLLDPQPVRIRVFETVPPEPPKLLDLVGRILDLADDLPPVQLEPEIVDVRSLAAASPAGHYLFPCRGAGATAGDAAVSYLDERPARHAWTLVGCARSRQLHEWFYGDLPPLVESCPRELAPVGDRPTLLKCCLLETGVERAGARVTVPWGASLGEVRAGLEMLVRVAEPEWALA